MSAVLRAYQTSLWVAVPISAACTSYHLARDEWDSARMSRVGCADRIASTALLGSFGICGGFLLGFAWPLPAAYLALDRAEQTWPEAFKRCKGDS